MGASHQLRCDIPMELKSFQPILVSVRHLLQHFPDNWTPVIRPERPNMTQGLAVCTGTLFDYGNWENLIQFVENYRYMGATWFTFYLHSATELVEMILTKYYLPLRIGELIRWVQF